MHSWLIMRRLSGVRFSKFSLGQLSMVVCSIGARQCGGTFRYA